MKLPCPIALAWIVLFIGGCQTPDPTVELLESELRWMEDQLYHMDDQLNQSYAQLASCRNNNALLRKELELSRNEPAVAKEGSVDEGDDSSDEELFNMTPPVIEQGEADGMGQPAPADDVPDAITVPPIIEMPERIEDNSQLGPAGEGDPFSTGNPSSEFERVSQIKLNRQLTGGYDFDGKPGDEGVMIVIEPQDAKGQYVPMAGGVTVSVTDPGQSGPASRVGKWEFDEAQTAGCLKRTLLGRGIHLELPWPAEFPRREQLQVDVAFSTIDGRRLRAQRDIKIDVVGSPSEIASQDARPQPWTASRAAEGMSNVRTPAARSSSCSGSPYAEDAELVVADRPAWKPQR